MQRFNNTIAVMVIFYEPFETAEGVTVPAGATAMRIGQVDSFGRPKPSDINTMAHSIDADGSKYNCGDYPQLYAAIGDTYCPKTIYRYHPAPWWQRILGRKEIPVEIPNPDYTPGMFRVPDFRNRILAERADNANDLHRSQSIDRGNMEEDEPLHRRLLW